MKKFSGNNCLSPRKCFAVISIFFLTLTPVTPGLAADAAWNVRANGAWGTGTNWTPASAPGSTSSTTNTDRAIFSYPLTDYTITITADAGRNIKYIDFDHTSSNSSKYLLSGGSLLLTDGGVIQTLAANGTHTDTITSAITIQGNGGTATFTAGATSTTSLLSIGDSSSSSASVTGVSAIGNTTTLTLNGSNTGSNTVAGIIGDGANGGKMAVVKSGDGVWVLSRANTYTGGLTLNAGTLLVVTNGALGSTGTLNLNGGTFASSSASSRTVFNSSIVGGNFSLGQGAIPAGAITLSGAMDLGGAVRQITVNNNSDTISGVISNGGITKLGSGRLILYDSVTNANTYTGATTISEGILTVKYINDGGVAGNLGAATSDAANLVFNGGTLQAGTATTSTNRNFTINTGKTATFDITANTLTMSGAAAATDGALTKTGSGRLTLSGVNQYTGATNVNAGILLVSNSLGLGTVAGGTSVADNASLQLSGGITVTGEALTLNGDTATSCNLWNNSGNNTWTGNITITKTSGASEYSTAGVNSIGTNTTGTGTLTISGNIAASTTANPGVAKTLALNSNGTTTARQLIVSGSISDGDGSNPLKVMVVGSGITQLSGTNTYTGSTTIGSAEFTNGSVEVYGGNAIGDSSSVQFYNTTGTSTRLLELKNANETVGSIGTSSTLSGPAIKLNSFTLTTGGNNATTAFSGVISGTGGSLTKTGSGTMTLSGTNTYTGVTTISAGTLSVAMIGNGGVAGNLGQASNAAGNLVFDGGTLQYTGVNASTDRNFTIVAGKTATIDVTADNLTISGASPATTGGLTKTGSGILTLSGVNLYTGATTITGGTLALSGSGSILSDISAVVHSGGTFDISGISAIGETVGSLSGAVGSAVALGGKIFTTGGDNTDTTFAGVLSGSGGVLTKQGSGTMTLTGVNTYTGGTTISGGTLSVGSSSALGLESNTLTIGSGTILNATDSFNTSRSTVLGGAGAGVGGTFDVTAGKTLTYTSSSVISGTGSLIKTGTGTLSLGGVDTYTGGTYIKAGTLVSTSNRAPGPQPTPGSNDYAHHIYDGATLQIAVGSWSTERQIQLMGDTGGMANIDILNGFTQQRNGLIYGAGGLNLNGTGTMTVTNANTYTGGTVIENGTLQVNNSAGSATGTGDVTVKTGGTLSGLPTAHGSEGITGSITGTVEVQSGGELLTQSGGTLTLGGLTLKAGALSIFQLGALTATKLVNVTGNNLFTLAGASTIEIVNTGLMEVGTYRLFDYLGSVPVFGNLSLAGTRIGSLALALVNNAGNTSIDLLVTAVTDQWQKGGVNTNWSTAGNWFGAEPDGIGADAEFINNGGSGFGTLAETVTVDSSKTVGSITFDNSTTAFTITSSGASTLTLDESGGNAVIQVLSAPNTANHVISAPLVLADNLTVNVASGTYGLDISGVISGAGKTITKTGLGPLTLSGTAANTYTGLTEVSGGTLNLNKTAGVDAIGTGGLRIDHGATAALLASNQIHDSATVTVNGTFALGTFSETIAALDGGGGVTTGSGSVLTINSGSDSSFIGTISGAGGIAKSGAGTLSLTGANSYTGGTAINAGTIQVGADNNLGGAGDITFGGGTLSFSGGFTSSRNMILSGNGTLDTDGSGVTLTGLVSGAGILTKDGTGTVDLNHANTYTGVTIIDGGILRLSNALALGSVVSGTTVNSGGEIELNGSGLSVNEPLTLHGGKICNLENTNTYGGAITLTANSTIDADDGTLIITSVIGESGGAYGLTKVGPGIVSLSGVNLYSGATTISEGTLALSGSGAIGDASAIVHTSGGIFDISGISAASETIGSLTGGSSSSIALGGKNLTTGGDGTSTEFAGVLSGSDGSLTKQGAGTMILSGVNTYTAGTTISAGALSVANSSALGLESNTLTIGSGTILKATDSFNTSRSTVLGGAGAGVGGTFDVTAGKTLTYTSSSVISGTGSLIKTGTGTLSLGGVDTYTGGTYIKAGTLVSTSNRAPGPQPTPGSNDYAHHIYDGATLQIAVGSWSTERQIELVGDTVGGKANIDILNGFTQQRNGLIYGAGGLNLNGTGTMTVTNANTYTGGTVIESGTLQVNNASDSATGTGDVTVKTGGTLSGLPTAHGSFEGITGSITGTVEVQSGGELLTQSGGTLTLGGLTLKAGALSIFQLGALTATKLVNVTGNNLFTLAGASTIEIVNTGLMAAGTYSLFGYAGTALTDISNLTLASTHVGIFTIALVNNEASNSIDLAVTSASTGEWTGSAAPDQNWSTAGNWSTGVVPDGTGAGAQFISGTSVATVDASKTVGSITFNNSTTAFTITGASTLTLDESGGNAVIQVLSAPATANHVISAPLILADDLVVNIASGDYGLDISGAISESVAGTTLTKTGSGPLTLSGTAANTYTGLTEVSAGTLNLNKTAGVDAIGTGGLQIDHGATAALLASNQIHDSATVTVNGTFALGTSSETIAALGGGGEVTTGSGSVLTINSGTDFSFIGTISGAGGITKSGAGTLSLTGVNSYTGGTAINAGTLQVGADNNLGGAGDITFGGGTLSFSGGFTSDRAVVLSGAGTFDTDGNDVTLTGLISGAGTLTKAGAGTLTLSAVNNYTGATTIEAGSTLGLDATGTIADSSSILNNGTLTVAAPKTIDSMTGIGGTTLTSGTLTIGDANATVATYAGVLSGAGNLATGAFAGSLTLSGVSTYTGSTTIGVGSVLALDTTGTIAESSGVINNGTFTVAATKTIDSMSGAGGTTLSAGTLTIGDGSNTSSAYDGVFSGAGGIKTGGTGTLTLGGISTFTGTTEIVAGSTLSIASGGNLGGGDVIHTGTFSIGLNTVNVGTYTQGGAATLNVTIDGANHGSIVGTGPATVSGTDILVLTVYNYIENNSIYTIIEGAGGAGVAAPIIQVAGNTHATFTVTTEGEDLILTANRTANGFASDAGGNANASAIGNVLDNIQGATGDMLTVLDILDGESSVEVGNALETMTPDMSSGTSEVSRALTGQGFATISNRLGGARSGFVGPSGISAGEMLNGLGVWMQGLGSYMKQGERKGIEGYGANLFGTTIGVDKLIDSHFRAGFAGSYGWARVNSKQPGSPSDDINSYQATLYGSYDSLDLCAAREHGKNSREAVRNQGDDFWYADGMLAFTQNNYDSRREIWLTPSNKRVAKAEHYGQQYSTNFEAGYTFTSAKTRNLQVTPFASLGYNFLYMNRYKEKGANALNLTVQGEGYSQLEQGLGTKLAYPIVSKKMGTFIPSAKAAWLYDYVGDRFQTTANFEGGGSSFITQGAKPAKNGMLFGAELGFLNKGNVTMTGNWDLELRDQFASNTYYGTVRYDF